MHYRLESPVAHNVRLVRRGAQWNATIYQCPASGSYWMLHMDKNGDRYLYSMNIDGLRSVIDKSKKYKVPDDWTGDPVVISVDEDHVRDGLADPSGASNLGIQINQWLDQGDTVLVMRHDGSCAGQIERNKDRLLSINPKMT